MKKALQYQAGGGRALANESRSARAIYMDLSAKRMTHAGAEHILRRAYDLNLLDAKSIEKLLATAWAGSEDWMRAGEPWTRRTRWYVNFGAGLDVDVARDLVRECPRMSPKVVQQIRTIIRRHAESFEPPREFRKAVLQVSGFELIEQKARARALSVTYRVTLKKAEI